MTRWFAALLLVAAATGCDQRPTHKGPDVVAVPEGFIYNPGMSAYRNFFGDRRKVLERGYTTASMADDDQSTITITEYDGPTTAAQVEESVRAEAEHYADCGPIETLTINKQPAWAWTQTQPKGAPKARSLNYRMVVSYPDASYLVEFYATQPRFMDHPERLKQAVMTFKVNR
jgi:hypothetical protein